MKTIGILTGNGVMNSRSVAKKMQLRITSFFKDRFNLFYISALLPIILVLYSGFVKRGDVVTWAIPFYGFLLLYIKKYKLTVFAQASSAWRVVGLALVAVSFFAYYVVVGFYPRAQFYGEVNYTILIIGLFLTFFELRALREAFAPLLLIVGATAIPFLGARLEVYVWPAIPFFVRIVGLILNLLGIPATQVDVNVFRLEPLRSGAISLSIIPACISIYSVSTFSILIAVTLIEDEYSNLRTKLFWAIGGAIGTFFLNLVRVSFIFVVIYYFGYENWPVIHEPIGYVMFLTWVGCFLLAFSKRQTIERGVQAIISRFRLRNNRKTP
jgi:exosortase/archaeosortase family protein